MSNVQSVDIDADPNVNPNPNRKFYTKPNSPADNPCDISPHFSLTSAAARSHFTRGHIEYQSDDLQNLIPTDSSTRL